MPDVYFWRQYLVILTLYLHTICDGMSYSFPGIVNMVILSPNTTDIRATPAEASNIAAIPGVGAFIGLIFISVLVQTIGRKLTFICILTCDLISWLILPFAGNVNTILVARLFRGAGDGLLYNSLIITEYADPKRRGYFATTRKMFVGLGALVSHTMALRYTFREISIFAAISLFIALILTCYWRESPAYSAYKGRFEECKKNFTWLHGDSPEKLAELENLMGAQMIRIEKNKKNRDHAMKTVLKTCLKKDLLKTSLLATILVLIVDLCGRHYYLAFMNQVFLMIVGDKSIAGYCSILSDTLTVLSLIMSSFVIHNFKRRTLLFTFGFLATTLLFIISIADFLKSQYSVFLVPWLEPVLMLILNSIVNMGVVPVNVLLTVEIYPLEHRGYGLCVSSMCVVLFNYLLGLKLTPVMVDSLGIDGTFCIFGFSIIICMIVLFYMMPETKNRPMQDIEDEVKNVDKSIIELRPMLLKERFDEL